MAATAVGRLFLVNAPASRTHIQRAHADLPLEVVHRASLSELCSDLAETSSTRHHTHSDAVVIFANDEQDGPSTSTEKYIGAIRSLCGYSCFVAVWHGRAVEDAPMRCSLFKAGANMLTCSPEHLRTALERLVSQRATQGGLTCHVCGMSGLTSNALHLHLPLYHTNVPSRPGTTCQQCGRSTSNMAVHIHEHHAPPGHMPEVRTGLFALVVVRRASDGRFLLVQEVSNWGLWLPGGGLNPGESLTQGAMREVLEEAGVAVRLTGLLALECAHQGEWRRAIFLGEPLDEAQVAKTLPDFESCGAVWVDPDQLPRLPLRNPTELQWLPVLAEGQAEVMPLAIPREWSEVFEDVRL